MRTSGTCEIFKECDDCIISPEEMKLILANSKDIKICEDPANGYVAVALDHDDEDSAMDLVCELNDIYQQEDNPCWWLGDEDEEYVFVF